MRRSKRSLIALMLCALCLVAACSSKSGKNGTAEGEQASGDIVAVSQGYETTAVSITLSKTEGNVDVADKSGNAVEKIDGMHLHNGNRVMTNDDSLAYLTLDEVKAAKLGQLSSMEVRKETKELSLYLESGEMFFNVSKHLMADEAMNIRTSTMVTGIRGTAGFVRVIDFYTTEIYVLDGEVWVTVIDPVTGAKKSAMVGAGQMATSAVFKKNSNPSERVDIIIKSFSEQDVPAFVIEEVSLNAMLQGRILSANVLNTSTLIGNYDEALIRDKEEGKKRIEKAKEEKDEYEQQKDVTDEMFSVQLADSRTCSLVDPTLPQVQEALDDEQYDTVNVSGTFVFGDGSEGLTKLSSVSSLKRGWSLRNVDKEDGEVLTIPAGKNLNLNGKTAFGSKGSIANYGILTNNGSFYIGGALNNIDEGQFINNGTVITPEEEKHEHMVVTDPEVKPTCTEDGYTQGSHCATCGEILEPQQVIPATGHKEQKLKAVAASCTKTGLTEGKKCSVCGEVLVKQETVPMTEHVAVATAKVDPTCTATGLTAGTKCKNCGKKLSGGEVIPANGHTEEYLPEVAASCTTAGHTAGTQCSVCHAVLSGLTTTGPLGHAEEFHQGYEADCENDGLTDGKFCTRCQTWTVPQTRIPAKGHKKIVDVAAKAANCTEPGCTEGWHCENCDEHVDSERIAPKGHTEKTIPYQAATCTEDGHTEYKVCETCGATLEDGKVLPAHGHEFNDIQGAPLEYCAYGCGTRNPNYVDPGNVGGDPTTGGNGTSGNETGGNGTGGNGTNGNGTNGNGAGANNP